MNSDEITDLMEKFSPLKCGLYPLTISKKENTYYVFDIWRKKNVVLTPEEWVRQNFLQYLVKEKNYPNSRIAVEKSLKIYGKSKRVDCIVYDRNLYPKLIIECKASAIPLKQDTITQLGVYNIDISATNMVITNGNEILYYKKNKDNSFTFYNDVPDYQSLLNEQ